MRIMVIILSSLAAHVLILHAALPLRLNELLGSETRSLEALAWVVCFGAWAAATALVYPAPGAAGWLFALACLVGFAAGAATDDRLLVFWGAVAAGLTVLTTVAQREQRAIELMTRHQEQREIAVYMALRSLQETVPELLARAPESGLDSTSHVAGFPSHRSKSRPWNQSGATAPAPTSIMENNRIEPQYIGKFD